MKPPSTIPDYLRPNKPTQSRSQPSLKKNVCFRVHPTSTGVDTVPTRKNTRCGSAECANSFWETYEIHRDKSEGKTNGKGNREMIFATSKRSRNVPEWIEGKVIKNCQKGFLTTRYNSNTHSISIQHSRTYISQPNIIIKLSYYLKAGGLIFLEMIHQLF